MRKTVLKILNRLSSFLLILDKKNPYHPVNIKAYNEVPSDKIPNTESLKDTYIRVIEFYKNEIENIIVDLSNNGVKIFLTSHDISQIRRIGKEIIFLDKGKLIYHDCIEKFFKDKHCDLVNNYINYG